MLALITGVVTEVNESSMFVSIERLEAVGMPVCSVVGKLRSDREVDHKSLLVRISRSRLVLGRIIDEGTEVRVLRTLTKEIMFDPRTVSMDMLVMLVVGSSELNGNPGELSVVIASTLVGTLRETEGMGGDVVMISGSIEGPEIGIEGESRFDSNDESCDSFAVSDKGNKVIVGKSTPVDSTEMLARSEKSVAVEGMLNEGTVRMLILGTLVEGTGSVGSSEVEGSVRESWVSILNVGAVIDVDGSVR